MYELSGYVAGNLAKGSEYDLRYNKPPDQIAIGLVFLSNRETLCMISFKRNMIYLLLIGCLISCKLVDENYELSTSQSCPSPIDMSEGEIVTYVFKYPNNVSNFHTITKLSVGEGRGEITYSVDGGIVMNFKLDELCSTKISPPSLSAEQAFILLGTSLTEYELTTESNDEGSSSSPTDFIPQNIEEECIGEMITVPAGEFSATSCAYVSSDGSEIVNKSIHNTIGFTPLRGLLQYQWTKGDQSITVELSDWNGL